MRPTTMGVLLGLAFMVATRAGAQDDGKAEVTALYKHVDKLSAAGETKVAARVYEKAVAGACVAYGKIHVVTAALMNNLALLYENMREYAKAEPLHKRSLEIREAGPEPPLRGDHAEQLGGVV